MSKKISNQSGFLAVGILLLGLAAIIIGNLLLLDMKILFNKTKDNPQVTTASSGNGTTEVAPSSAIETSTSTSSGVTVYPDGCLAECQLYIEERIASLRTELLQKINATPAQTVEKIVTQSTSPQIKELYVGFGVGGSSQSIPWVDVAGTDITFDTSNYPGAKEYYFLANLKSDAPDRASYARIYDATSSVGVIGSDITVTSLSSTLVQSGKLTISSGVRKLRVQIHSLNGNFATVESPRIKVVY